MRISVWDLDGTVINSNHRHATKADGSLDLEHWIENNTPQKIARDTLLPLIHTMRVEAQLGKFVVICTARVLARADYIFLRNNKVPFDYVLSRPRGDATGDAELKVRGMSRLLSKLRRDWSHCEMWDDNTSVIEVMRSLGVKVNDAKTLNYSRSE